MLREYDDKSKDFINLPKILICLYNNVILLFEEQKKLESKNLGFAKANKGIAMFLSKCAVCDSKKSRFITQQELVDC